MKVKDKEISQLNSKMNQMNLMMQRNMTSMPVSAQPINHQAANVVHVNLLVKQAPQDFRAQSAL